jgi:hypothetical protein
MEYLAHRRVPRDTLEVLRDRYLSIYLSISLSLSLSLCLSVCLSVCLVAADATPQVCEGEEQEEGLNSSAVLAPRPRDRHD